MYIYIYIYICVCVKNNDDDKKGEQIVIEERIDQNSMEGKVSRSEKAENNCAEMLKTISQEKREGGADDNTGERERSAG